MNKGMLSHYHGMKGMSLLYDYHWTFDLLRQVQEELIRASQLMREHLSLEKCGCGDSEEEVHFYSELLQEVKQAIENKDLSAVPWVQEKLHAYMLQKFKEHNCITRLLRKQQTWILEAQL
ncbi:hypothetical protein [Ammoniphilus sp. YIM 78166]|uniref:hypothetical protein n=1 Tax=Ammoniphilus sp. YIM 78166 TaxID=1644106 RepID=UPI00107036A7|nr:hypothetical protein [Ammoniphilus sp. YIM 78166]